MPQPVKVWNEATADNFGTLTCIARLKDDPSQYFAMCASHVLAPIAVEGSRLSPSLDSKISYLLPGEQQSRELGTLANWAPLYAGGGWANKMDAAIVSITSELAHSLIPVVSIGTGVEEPPSTGSGFKFYGAATAGGSGVVDGELKSVQVQCRSADGTDVIVQMIDLIPVTGLVQPGDSGALLLDEANRAIGILVAEGLAPNSGYFYSLDRALEYFRLKYLDAVDGGAAAAATNIKFLVGEPALAEETLSKTLWGEARGEGVNGIRAVAAVVLNRASRGPHYWWGGDIVQVCLKRDQFSCWKPDDPNLPKMRNLDAVTDKEFQLCLAIAREAISNGLNETSLGATHYHARSVYPKWARGKIPCDEIRNHIFYNNIEPL